MSNVVNQVLGNMTDEQKESLLISFVTAEYNKKTNEINKNYKDENKRAFAHSNIVNELTQRLIKKLYMVQGKQEIAQQVESLESLL